MYLGPAKQATSYFATLGYSCPKLFNPSDYFLDILSPDNRSLEAETTTNERIRFLGDSWTEYYHANVRFMSNDEVSLKPIASVSHPWTSKRFGSTVISDNKIIIINYSSYLLRFSRNFLILCWRSWVSILIVTYCIIICLLNHSNHLR